MHFVFWRKSNSMLLLQIIDVELLMKNTFEKTAINKYINCSNIFYNTFHI